jgi:hypothetical protein
METVIDIFLTLAVYLIFFLQIVILREIRRKTHNSEISYRGLDNTEEDLEDHILEDMNRRYPKS